MVSSLALLLAAATPAPTAEEIMAARRARTSVIAMEARDAGARERLCAEPRSASADEVVVCGQREDERYRVPATDVGERGPGVGGMQSVQAAQAAVSTCGIGADHCERPVFDGAKALDFVIKVVRALTDGE